MRTPMKRAEDMPRCMNPKLRRVHRAFNRHAPAMPGRVRSEFHQCPAIGILRLEEEPTLEKKRAAPVARHREQELLQEIRDTLLRANPPPPTGRLAILLQRFQTFVKYIGLPAVFLAAILPVYELLSAAIEHRNISYMHRTYIEYATTLADRREFERAQKIVQKVNELSHLDAAAQYASARILAEAAYNQAKSYDEAEDAISILLSLHRNRPWLFPSFGGEAEILALDLRLVDIDLKRTLYKEALARVDAIRESNHALDVAAQARLAVQEGRGHLYLYQAQQALPHLKDALRLSRTCGCKNLQAEAEHALGTLYFFQGENGPAVVHLETARQIFEAIDDKDGLARTWTNLSLVRGAEFDWPGALAARRQQERLSRELHDELGIGNALVGLAMIERNLGDFNTALTYALEAEEIFKRMANPTGIAAALQNQANIYSRLPDFARALETANRALPYFYEQRDIRGTIATLGVLARAAEALGNDKELAFAAGATVGLARLNASRNPADERDLHIHLAMIERLRDYKPDVYFRAKEEAERRIREMERTLRTPRLETGLDEESNI
jgi:tetratricopeptide (TPR) repeat protein